MVAPNSLGVISEKNGSEVISETKYWTKDGNGREESDYFLKGFLDGYRMEKERIQRMKIKKE